MKIGFIGLGIMGSRMATNLQKNGRQLIVHNRSREKAQTLLENGADWADSPAAVAADADLLFTMLAHPEAVRESALGAAGFLDHLSPGSLWVDCSTVNPSFSREMAAEAAQRQIRFVDAPVAGSKDAAADAHLRFIAGGAADDVAACQSMFDEMGQGVVHVGGPGMGTALKVVVNYLLAASMAAFAEGMALAQAQGLSQEMLFKVLLGGPVVAPFVSGKQAKMTSGDYEPDFPLRWMQKDLQMTAVTAYEAGVPMPLGNIAKEMYQQAIQNGWGDSDFSAIYEFLNQ